MGTLQGIDLSDPDVFTDGPPHAAYRALRDHAPLFWHEPTDHTPDGEGFWCLTRHADVTWAARQSDVFSSMGGGERAGGGTLIEDLPAGFAAGVLLNMQDDPRHHHIRRLVTPSVSPKRLRSLRDALHGRCAEILDAAVEAGDVDFLVAVAAELPLQAIAALLGIAQADRHFLLDWADATLDHELGDDATRSQDAAVAMADYTRTLLADKRRCPAEDILSLITHAELPEEAEPGGPLSAIEQEMFVHLLVAAGSETTRNTITAGMLALIERPDDWDALRADRSLLPGAVEEMLRWASSTTYNRRTATRDVECHGQTIRAGDKVVLWWQAADFDERVFVDPHRFDIRRDPNPHVAFGLGSHFCLGANLARLEISLVFDGLLDRVPRPTATGRPERTRSNKHAGFRHAPVRLQG